MKTILFLITGLAYGGAETQVVHMAKRLKGRGWEVRVVSLIPPKAYVQEMEATGIPVATLGKTGSNYMKQHTRGTNDGTV